MRDRTLAVCPDRRLRLRHDRCIQDPDLPGGEICSVITLELRRDKGKSTFNNVSKYLLYVNADVDGDGTVDRVPLFDKRFEDFLWY